MTVNPKSLHHAEPRVRAGVLMSVMALSRSLAGDRWAQVQGVLKFPVPDDSYAWIPLRAYLHFFEDIAAALDEPSFGLKISSRYAPREFGPLGFLFLNGSNVADGVSQMGVFMSAWQEDTQLDITLGKQYAILSYRVATPELRTFRRQDAEFSLGALTAWMRLLLGRSWQPAEVHFEHQPPADHRGHESYFGAPVYFGVSQNALIFDVNDAVRLINTREGELVVLMRRHLDDLMEPLGGENMVQRVRRVVAGLIGKQPVSVPKVAKHLHMSPRSLQRRLAEEQASMRSIIREERLRLGTELLSYPRVSGGEIAQALGYADSAVANRAFKSWTGTSPRRYAMARHPEAEPDHANDSHP